VYRLDLLAKTAVLAIPSALAFKALFRSRLPATSLAGSILKIISFRIAGFASAWAVARLVLGGQGLASYLLVVTYVSLLLLLPLDAMAQVWAREGGSWVDNATWLAATESFLLASVTPLV